MRTALAITLAVVAGVVNAAYDDTLAMKALYYSSASYCNKQTVYDW